MEAENRTRVRRLRVSSTGFLDDLVVDFSEGLNCIIGARGTGKTSMLELLRFALGREDDWQAHEPAVLELVRAAIGLGSVEVDVTTDAGLDLTVHRESSGEHNISNPDGFFETLVNWPPFGPSDIAIYSQNQLEEVSLDPSARLQMLDTFCGSEVARIQQQIGDTKRQMQVAAVQIGHLTSEIDALQLQLESLPKLEADQLASETRYQEALAQIKASEADKKDVTQLASRRQGLSREQSLLDGLVADADAAASAQYPGVLLGQRLNAGLSESVLAELPSRDELTSLRAEIAVVARQHAELRVQMQASLEHVRDVLRAALDRTAARLKDANLEFDRQSKKLGAIDRTWKEISTRRESVLAQVRNLQVARDSNTQRAARVAELQANLSELRARFAALRRHRFEVRRAAALSLNDSIGATVRIQVRESGAAAPYEEYLAETLKGSGLWYNRLATKVAEVIPPNLLAEIVRSRDAKQLAALADVDAERARRTIEHLADSGRLNDIESFDVEDAVEFELRMEDGNYAASEHLSQGQRCTTVLTILMVDSSSPLFIDQPEDNLDNSYVVQSVVEVVRRQKAVRQFVFVTHNANVPVLAEAERVIAMSAPDGKGSIECEGPWDARKVSQRIVDVMEGGAAAFLQRGSAYREHGALPPVVSK